MYLLPQKAGPPLISSGTANAKLGNEQGWLFHPSFRGMEQLARLSFQRGSNYCSITHFKRPAAVRAYSLMKELFKAVLKNSCGALFHVVAGCIVAIFPPFRWGYCFARPKRPGYHAVPPLISRGGCSHRFRSTNVGGLFHPSFRGVFAAVVRASGPDV